MTVEPFSHQEVAPLLVSCADRVSLHHGYRQILVGEQGAVAGYAAEDVFAGLREGGGGLPEVVLGDWGNEVGGRPGGVGPGAAVGVGLELRRVEGDVRGLAAVDGPGKAQARPGHDHYRCGRAVDLLGGGRNRAVGAGGQVVGVVGVDRQRNRLAHHGAAEIVAPHFEFGRDVAAQGAVEAAEGAADFGGDHLRVDAVIGFERAISAVGLALAAQGPDDFTGAEVAGHIDGEQERIAARVEVRRLAHVGGGAVKAIDGQIVEFAGADMAEVIVRADGDIELLLPV